MNKSGRLLRQVIWVLMILCVIWASPASAKSKKGNSESASKSSIKDKLKAGTKNIEGVDSRSDEEKAKIKAQREADLKVLREGSGGNAIKADQIDTGDEVNEAEVDAILKQIESKNRRLIDKFKGLLKKRHDSPKAAEWRFQIAELEWEISSYRQLRDMKKYIYKSSELSDNDVPEEEWPEEPKPDFEKSIEQFELIIAQHSDYKRLDEVLFKLGDGLIRAGNPDKGVGVLKNFTDTYPKSPLIDVAYLSLGEYYFEKRNTAFSEHYYGKIVSDHPKSKLYNYAQYKLGWTYYNLGDEEGFEKAIETFKAVVEHLDNAYPKCVNKATGLVDPDCLPKGEVSFRNQAINDLVVAHAEVPNGWKRAREYFTKKLDKPKLRTKMEMFAELLADKGFQEDRIEIYRWLISEDSVHEKIPTYAERIIDAHFENNSETKIEGTVREFIEYFEPNGKWFITNASNERAAKQAHRFAEDKLYSLAADYLQKALASAEAGSAAKQEEADRYFTTSRGDHETFLKRYPDSKYMYDMNFYYAYLLDELSERNLNKIKSKHGGKATEAYIAEAKASALPDLRAAAAQYQVVISLDHKAPKNADPAAAGQGENYTQTAANRQVFVYANILTTVDPTWSIGGKIQSLKVNKGEEDKVKNPIDLTQPEKDFIGSVEQYSKLFSKDSETPGFLWRAADLYLDKFHYEDAAQRFDDLVSNFPDHEYAGYAINSMFQLYNKSKNWPKIEYWAEWLITKKNFKVYKKNQLEDAIAYSIQNQSLDLYKAKSYKLSAEKIYSIKERFPQRKNLVIPAMFAAARTYRDGDLIAPAIKHYEEFLSMFPNEERTPLGTFELALLFERKTDFVKSANLLESLPEVVAKTKAVLESGAPAKPSAKAKPKSKAEEAATAAGDDYIALVEEKMPQALTTAINIRRGLQQWDKALATSKLYLSTYPDGEFSEEVDYRLGEIQKMADHHEASIADYRSYLTRYGATGNKVAQMKAHLSIAHSIAKIGGRSVAKDQDREFTKIEGIYASLDEDAKLKGGDMIAELNFIRAERKFELMLLVKLEFPQRVLNKRVKEKFKLIADSKQAYNKVASFKQARWSSAAAYRNGAMFLDFRDQIKNLPIPEAVKKNEDSLETYMEFMDLDVVAPAEEAAIDAFGFALALAHELKVYNEWSRKSAKIISSLTPDNFPVTNEKGVSTEHVSSLSIPAEFLLSSTDRGKAKSPKKVTTPAKTSAGDAAGDAATPEAKVEPATEKETTP